MSSIGFELQKSLYSALVANPALTGLLGGPRIYDDVPRGAAMPYVTFGQSSLRDWSTGDTEGAEHIVTLHVWSDAAGRKATHEIVGAARAVLHDRPITVAGHRLVNLRHEFSETRRDADGETYHGILRFRAVTEPVAA